MTWDADHLRILLVEDDEDDFVITRDLLRAQDRVRFTVDWAASYEDALEAVASCLHDVYIVDYRLGAHTGLDLVRTVLPGCERAPVILLTGQGDYAVDLEATSLGVTDFLLKDRLDSAVLERSIRYAFSHHSALRRLRESEERFALAVHGASDGIWDWDLRRDRVYFAPRWKDMLGLPATDVPEGPEAWLGRVHSEDLSRLQHAIAAHLDGRSPHFESEHRMRHDDGSFRWMFSRGVAIRDEQGTATRMAGSMSDITARKSAEERLVHDALHDALTGLPNRGLFRDRLALALRRAERQPDYRCAVLFLDIDRFKVVNDGFTHIIGDQLLVALGRRLVDHLRPGDTVARLGGDEFTLLLDGVSTAEDAMQTAQRIQDVLREPFVLDGRSLTVSASIGISLSGSASQPAEMMRDADIAMYDAKRQGAGRISVFTTGMHSRAMTRLKLETELRAAIDEGTLRVFYQPIVHLATAKLRGLEALVRWPIDDPGFGPDEFIPVAEDVGLIGDLGRLVMRRACAQLSDWRSRGLVADEITMSVNVSCRQLADHQLVGQICLALDECGLPADALRIEVTESTLMHNPERMRAVLDELGEIGVRLHVDDFGTGYSSLTFLHRFPGETLKIDRSFISPMLEDHGSAEIVRMIMTLAHSLGLSVVAEGVETPEQAAALVELGCQFGQGFLWARPMPAEAVEICLARGHTLGPTAVALPIGTVNQPER